jgi:DNA end-binding protein Ku
MRLRIAHSCDAPNELASEEHDLSFKQLRKSDGARIGFKRVAEIDQQEAADEDIAQGYELPGGEMIALTDHDCPRCLG